jgi:hypothetical protein
MIAPLLLKTPRVLRKTACTDVLHHVHAVHEDPPVTIHAKREIPNTGRYQQPKGLVALSDQFLFPLRQTELSLFCGDIWALI